MGPGTTDGGPSPDPGELAAELDRYRALVEHAPDAIVVFDADAGHFAIVNAAAERLFGTDRETLLRQTPAAVSPPVQPDGRDSEEAARAEIGRALAGERPTFRWTHRRGDGTDVACEVTLLRLPGSRLVRGILVDVTERIAAERDRRQAAADAAASAAAEAGAARLRAMVAGLDAVVWESDPATGAVRYVNEKVEELLGHPRAEWLTDPGLWQRVLHPADRDRVLAERAAAVRDRDSFTLGYRVRAADGRVLWLRHLGHVERDAAGTPLAVHAVLVDDTADRRREQAADVLARAARALTDPGTLAERLTAVTALLAGRMCDRASVWLRADDGLVRPVAAAPPEAAERMLALPPLTPPPDEARRYAEGRPYVVPMVGPDLRREAASHDAERLGAIDRLDPHGVLTVPLVASDEVVGLLLLTSTGTGWTWDDADVALAGELGSRIATCVAAEKHAERQAALYSLTVALSAAGTVVEASAALVEGLRSVLGAQVASVAALSDDGVLRLVHMLGYPPERASEFATMRLSAQLPITDAARTGRPVWLPDRESWSREYPDVFASLLPSTRAGVALPLTVGDRVLGVVSASFPAVHGFDEGERAFLLSLAGQAAVAFERAALADARREVAETLQRSLLPHGLPELDRLAVAARYLPGVQGTQAGGDWYDVLPLDDGAVAVVVGDVVGNGAPAAAVMGQLRSALATLLLEGHGPARALTLLDRVAERVDGARVCTVACLRLDPDGRRLAYSLAGHLPPLLLTADGVARLDGGRGPALGVGPVISPVTGPVTRTDAHAELPPGSALVLYTDGLVERRAVPVDQGVDRLAAALGAAGATIPDPGALAGALLDALVEGAGPADDVALVVARPLPAPLAVDLSADPHELARLRHLVRAFAADAGLGVDALDDLQLALGETVTNAVEHGYRDRPGATEVRVRLLADGSVTSSVRDHGSWRPPPADPGSRGRGLALLRALATDVAVEPGADGTAVRFRLAPRVAAEASALPPSSRDARGEGDGGGDGKGDGEGRPAAVQVADAGTGLGGPRRCVALAGDLDLVGAAAVRGPLLEALAAPGPTTLDLTGVGHLASAGLGLLLDAVRATAPGLEVLLPPDGAARRVLELTGVGDLLAGASGGA